MKANHHCSSFPQTQLINKTPIAPTKIVIDDINLPSSFTGSKVNMASGKSIYCTNSIEANSETSPKKKNSSSGKMRREASVTNKNSKVLVTREADFKRLRPVLVAKSDVRKIAAAHNYYTSKAVKGRTLGNHSNHSKEDTKNFDGSMIGQESAAESR